MSDREEIILEYVSGPIDPPGFWGVVWGIIGAVLSGIASALIESAKKFAQEALSLFTLERLIGAGTQYLREQTATWLTKTLSDAGQQEWIANFLHAFGLDLEDLLQVGKNALDSGFKVLTSELSTKLTEMKLLDKGALDVLGLIIGTHKDDIARSVLSSGQATQQALATHGSMIARAYKDWTMFSASNFSAEETKLRAQLEAIFTDTPERIEGRAELETERSFSAAADLSQKEMEVKLPGIVRTLGKSVRPIQDWLNDMLLTVRNSLFYILAPKLPVSYEQVGVAALGAYSTAVGLGMTSHAVAVMADLIHPLKSTGIPQLAAFLADMAGFAAIARATWYEDVRNFLATPYRHYSLRYFRPTLPGTGDLTKLYAENCILEEDFDRAMQYWGYTDRWIRAWKRNVFRDPGHRELSAIAEDANISTAWVYAQLRDAGYSPDDSPELAHAIIRRSLRSYLEAYRKQLMSIFSKGYMSEEQFDAQLDVLELTSEAYFLTKKVARFKFIEDYTDDSVRMFQDMYDKDLIDDDDLETSLTALGIVPEKRTVLVARSRIKRTARVASEERAELKRMIRKRQQLIIDTYVLAYRAGTLDEDGLLAALKFAGIEVTLATLTVELEKQKRALMETRTKARTKASQERLIAKKYEQGYIELYRDGIIDEEELETFLKALGLEDDYVKSVVEVEFLKKQKPEPLDIK